MTHDDHRYNDGLERAALHLYRTAGTYERGLPKETIVVHEAMARIFKAEAEEILALRKK